MNIITFYALSVTTITAFIMVNFFGMDLITMIAIIASGFIAKPVAQWLNPKRNQLVEIR